MGDRLYRLVRCGGGPFRYAVFGAERLPASGPLMVVGNHSASVGPVQSVLSLPLRLYPWARAEMCDPARAPAFLYDDFVVRELRLRGRLGKALSALICMIAVPLLRGIGCVPVNRDNGFFDSSFAESLALLKAGKSLLIFPEDGERPIDPRTGMNPFNPGFAWLCFRYEHETGRSLPVYPLSISPERRQLCVGAPLRLDLHGDRKSAIWRLVRQAERRIGALQRDEAAELRRAA